VSPLPNCHGAVIEDDKLVAYALNPASERGRHKARLFASVLGYSLANWQDLKAAILGALPHHEAVRRSATPFGVKHEVVVPLVGPTGRLASVRTIWQYDQLPNGTLSDTPRLVTLYIE
jgi:hypothetical protein